MVSLEDNFKKGLEGLDKDLKEKIEANCGSLLSMDTTVSIDKKSMLGFTDSNECDIAGILNTCTAGGASLFDTEASANNKKAAEAKKEKASGLRSALKKSAQDKKEAAKLEAVEQAKAKEKVEAGKADIASSGGAGLNSWNMESANLFIGSMSLEGLKYLDADKFKEEEPAQNIENFDFIGEEENLLAKDLFKTDSFTDNNLLKGTSDNFDATETFVAKQIIKLSTGILDTPKNLSHAINSAKGLVEKEEEMEVQST